MQLCSLADDRGTERSVWRFAHVVAVLVSAALQDFLNGVCTHTIWITQRQLTYYTGEGACPAQKSPAHGARRSVSPVDGFPQARDWLPASSFSPVTKRVLPCSALLLRLTIVAQATTTPF